MLQIFDISWVVLPRAVEELCDQWRFKTSLNCQRMLCALSLFAGLWKIWIERNRGVFETKSSEVFVVVDSIVRAVSDWASRGKQFEDILLHDMYRSWKAVVEGGKTLKTMVPTSWMLPPMGLLKLNFDGSFFKDLSHGGWEGTTCQIFVQIFGPVECLDSYGAEVFAMLMSCCYLFNTRGYKDMIEGDSYSALRWGNKCS